MKIDLRKIVITALLTGPVSMMGQSWNVGVEAGYVDNTLAVKEYKSTGRNGFKLGGEVEYTLGNRISFESGLAYIRKGGGTSGKNMWGSEITSVKFEEMNYLQIPLMVGYKFGLGSKFSIKPEVGAYYAVGVGGHTFVSGTDAFGQVYEKRVSTFSGAEGVPYRPCNRNDGGLAFALNLSYRHFTVKAEYDLGLATATYYGDGKQRTFSVSLAYWIF